MQELLEIILRHATERIKPTNVPGLTPYRSNETRSSTVPMIYTPIICVMAQGEKEVVVGSQIFRYTPSDYLVSSIDLPVRGTVMGAGRGRPYLSVSLELDRSYCMSF